MGNSLMVGGCKLGMDVRLCAPEHLWPADDLVKTCREIAEETGARLTLTADVDEGVRGVDFLYTDVWVSMGEDKSVWEERIELLKPYQVNADVVRRTGNPHVKFLHCLPAFHNRDTKVGEEIFQTVRSGRPGGHRRRLRVTRLDRLRPGREPAAHHQGRHGRHPRVVRRGASMRVVVALGGNALLQARRTDDAEMQRTNVRKAAPALAAIAADHQLVLSHGNGPQVGLLALQAAAYTDVEPSTLDVLGAQTAGDDRLRPGAGAGQPPARREPLATILTMVEVDTDDPAFANPTKFVGPIYSEAHARQLAEEKGWPFKQDGESWRRVVPSPAPKHIFEIRPIRWLLDRDVVVICAGGGGIPTMSRARRRPLLSGVEAVIDKDLASELLAREVDADLFVMATDVDGVYADWGTPDQRRLDRVTPEELRGMQFPPGRWVPRSRPRPASSRPPGEGAAIGGLGEIEQIVKGTAGTQVVAA